MRKSRAIGPLLVMLVAVMLTGSQPVAVEATEEPDPVRYDFPARPVVDDLPAEDLIAAARAHDTDWDSADVRQCGVFALWRVGDNRGSSTAVIAEFGTAAAARDGRVEAHELNDAALDLGYQANRTPAVGALGVLEAFHRGAGEDGHVFYVAKIFSDGSLLIEHYNWGDPPLSYSTKRVPADWYVHLDAKWRPTGWGSI